MASKFSYDQLPRPFFASAPLDGISDSAFRQMQREGGADIVYSEMTIVEGLASKHRKYFPMLNYDPMEHPVIIQLFGKEPVNFAKAAKLVEEVGADGVDVNMGCPASHVRKSGHGVALMENPDRAEAVIAAIHDAVSIPVSAKIRLGWDENVAVDVAMRLERAGAACLTIHPRFGCQAFKGELDWDTVREIVSKVKIPVVASGNMKNVSDALNILRYTGCAGIMIGRGSLGFPWIFKSLQDGTDYEPTTAERVDAALRHVTRLEKMKGQRGIFEARKHLAWYIKCLPDAANLRDRLVRVNGLEEAREILMGIPLDAVANSPRVFELDGNKWKDPAHVSPTYSPKVQVTL